MDFDCISCSGYEVAYLIEEKQLTHCVVKKTSNIFCELVEIQNSETNAGAPINNVFDWVDCIEKYLLDIDQRIALEPIPAGMLGPIRSICPYRVPYCVHAGGGDLK
jgi:hypothetical protein